MNAIIIYVVADISNIVVGECRFKRVLHVILRISRRALFFLMLHIYCFLRNKLK